MELIIYNNILYGSLKPWHCNDSDNKYYRQRLTPSLMTPEHPDDYFSALKNIHPDKTELYADDGWDVYQTVKQSDREYTINAPLVTTEHAAPLTSTQRFYHFLLSNETTRITNRVYNTYTREISEISKRGIIQEVVKSTKDLLLKIGTDYQTFPQDDLSKYVIRQLIQNLIRLLKEIELLFPKDLISIASSKEEIYSELLGIEIPEGDIDKPTPLFTTVKSQLLNSDKYDIAKSDKFSFGYKNGNVENLKSVMGSLQRQLELVDENRCSISDFISILTSKDIVRGSQPIYLQCETTQFSYIIGKIGQHFTNFTPTTIEQSNLFYSKKGTLLKRNNLYKNKSQYPKDQQTIDTILKGL